MNALRHILFIFGALFVFYLPSCINDDFTDSPSATLSFSKDTVNFGALFTDMASPTARLVVRNKNSKGVRISSVAFADPETPFRLNVDGVSGSVFNEVEIRANDSIFLFIECYLDADDSDELRKVSDQLEFVTNGVKQQVEVEAWAWNVTRLKAVTLDHDMTLTARRPYVIFDSLVVNPGVTLNVEPGAMLLFHDKASMKVKGTLLALGTPENIIMMRGDRLDDVLPDVGYDILAGQWGGVDLTPESFGNRMEYVDMRSTVSGLRIDSCTNLSQKKLTLVNCWLHNSRESVLKSEYAWVDAIGCCFSEAADAVVKLKGGKHNFLQCTIANAYLFSSLYQPNLMLLHCLPEDSEENSEPLMTASFENTIIWGEIGDPLEPGDLTGSDVFFRYTLLKADGSDDDNFINCFWNVDPLYLTVRSDYYFNYRLQPESPALHEGNPDYVTSEALIDMDGLNRLADGNPALGAYAD